MLSIKWADGAIELEMTPVKWISFCQHGDADEDRRDKPMDRGGYRPPRDGDRDYRSSRDNDRDYRPPRDGDYRPQRDGDYRAPRDGG